MAKYLVQRLALAVPTLLGLTILVFFLLRVVIPIDSVDFASASAGTTDTARDAQLREELGLTGPLPLQYVRWVSRVVTGNFGRSFFTGRSVASELRYRIPTSLELGAGAIIITVVIAIPIGLLSAARQDSVPDYLARGLAILFYAIPGFWVATLILVFGSLWFSWAPAINYRPLWEDPGANIRQIFLPMMLLGLASIGTMVRLVRTQVLEVIRQDYVRTARAKGLGPRDVYFRHVLRNSMLPIVTVVGLQLPRVLAGTVIFEQIFVLPGVGRYLLDSIQRLDLYVIMGTNLFFGFVLVIGNIAVDTSYGFIDPRIRLARR